MDLEDLAHRGVLDDVASKKVLVPLEIAAAPLLILESRSSDNLHCAFTVVEGVEIVVKIVFEMDCPDVICYFDASSQNHCLLVSRLNLAQVIDFCDGG